MDQLFAKYPMLLQLQDDSRQIVLWFLTGGNPNDPASWLSESRTLEEVDPQMQSDVLAALGDRKESRVVMHPIARAGV